MPTVSMTTFLDYMQASGPARLQIVSRQLAQYGQEYRPGRDFYRPMLLALVADLRLGTGTHHLDAAVARARPIRAPHYDAVRRGLAEVVRTLGRRGVSIGPRPTRWQWTDTSARIKVTPDFLLEHRDGSVQAVKVHFKQAPLDRWTAAAGIRLMQYAGAALASPVPVEPCLLDARRGKLWRPDGRTPVAGLDKLLASEAAAYGSLWTSLAAAS